MRDNRNNGFTIVEVAVIAPFLLLTLVAVLGILVVTLNTVSTIQSMDAATTKGARLVQDQLEQDIKYGLRFITGPLLSDDQIADSNPPVGGVDFKHRGTLKNGTTSTDLNTMFVINLNQTRSHAPGLSSATIPVTWGPCTSHVGPETYSEMIPIVVVYFVDQGTLYRRTVIHDDTFNGALEKCGTPLIQQSCQSPPQTKCTVQDQELLRNVVEFKVDYYRESDPNTPIDAYNSSSPYVLNYAKKAGITLKTSQTIAGELVEYQSKFKINRDFLLSSGPE